MKSLFNCMSAACIIAAGGAFAEEVNGKWGGKVFTDSQNMVWRNLTLTFLLLP